MSHACPSFLVRIAAKCDTGFVVEDAGTPGAFFNLFKGSLAAKGKSDAAQAAFDRLKVGDSIPVTCQDPENHAHHKGPDGAMRPNVSAWLVHATKNADEAKTKVDAALAWDKAGGGKPIVTDVRETFVLAEVREGRTPFTGLWHKSAMPAGVSFEALKEGAKVPVKLRVQEAQVQGSRAVIRFKAVS